MAIEDYVDLADLFIGNDYYYTIVKDLKNNTKRYCMYCGSEMKISKKGNPYCSSICWENDIGVINKEKQQEEQNKYDLS